MTIAKLLLTALVTLVAAATAAAECPTENAVHLSSRNGAYDSSLNWSTIRTGRATVSSSRGKSAMWIHLANFEIARESQEDLSRLPLAEGQGMLTFVLTRQIAGQTEVPITTGTYDFSKSQGSAEQTGSVKIRVPGGRSVSFDMHGTEGSFDVTQMTTTQICGSFSLKDKFTEVSGTFNVPLR